MQLGLHGHRFAAGVQILTASLATCHDCGTLRVVEAGRPTVYIRAVYTEPERVREDEPPCLRPLRRPAPW